MTGIGDDPFVAAVKPLVDAMGGEMLAPELAGVDDVVLSWEGADVVAVRLPQLADSLDHILAALERKRASRSRSSTARPSRRSCAYWKPAGPSPCGTVWRPWRARSA